LIFFTDRAVFWRRLCLPLQRIFKDMATKNIKTQYYYDYVGELKDGMAVVRNNGKYGFIDKTGKEIVPPIYDFASDFKNGESKVKYKNQYRTINSEGKVVEKFDIEQGFSVDATKLPAKTKKNTTRAFNDKYVQFMKKGKWGLKDMSGKEVIPPIYNAFKEFGNELIQVKKNRKWGLIDMSGKEITKIKYDEIRGREIRVGCLWGLLDENGNDIVAPKYFNRSSLYKTKDEFRRELLNN
jgi:hypothetical protein